MKPTRRSGDRHDKIRIKRLSFKPRFLDFLGSKFALMHFKNHIFGRQKLTRNRWQNKDDAKMLFPKLSTLTFGSHKLLESDDSYKHSEYPFVISESTILSQTLKWPSNVKPILLSKISPCSTFGNMFNYIYIYI
jgi:hypothetical protein